MSSDLGKTVPLKAVAPLTPQQCKRRIDACLDEFEATVDGVRRSKCKDPHELRFAKAWGNLQKITLRSLGYRKRLPVIGGSRVESGTLPPSEEPTDKEDIFEVFGKENNL